MTTEAIALILCGLLVFMLYENLRVQKTLRTRITELENELEQTRRAR